MHLNAPQYLHTQNDIPVHISHITLWRPTVREVLTVGELSSPRISTFNTHYQVFPYHTFNYGLFSWNYI